jgi:hypothetical protein
LSSESELETLSDEESEDEGGKGEGGGEDKNSVL